MKLKENLNKSNPNAITLFRTDRKLFLHKEVHSKTVDDLNFFSVEITKRRSHLL